jgi:transposase InsO family protein
MDVMSEAIEQRAGQTLGPEHAGPFVEWQVRCDYLAVVLDAWSRRIVGWAFSTDLKTRVVLNAPDMALMARKPDNVVHHSDSQCIGASSWAA